LLEAKVIREVIHMQWLANPVLVKKSNRKWKMCIDFTKLNKACSKDDFPLARIDQIVDFTAGCEHLCFLDAYSGYHQVWMAKEDEPHTSFITPLERIASPGCPLGYGMLDPHPRRWCKKSLQIRSIGTWRRTLTTLWSAARRRKAFW
jgi:hypothetical protein